jgi:hypothetical protein
LADWKVGGTADKNVCATGNGNLTTNVVVLWFKRMSSITLKDIPADLHAQLKREANANFRSLNQEAMARIQRSFDLDERFTTAAVNQLIDQAVNSGPEQRLTRTVFDTARQVAHAKFAKRKQAA